jgi:hypothetical protein
MAFEFKKKEKNCNSATKWGSACQVIFPDFKHVCLWPMTFIWLSIS